MIGSLAIALAGCGGDDGKDAATAASNTGTGSTITVADTAPANGTGASSTVGGTSVLTPPAAQSAATSVTFSWTPPNQNNDGSPITNLAGYKIHYGTTSSDYTQTVSVENAGLTRYVVDNLPSGTYYFAITAYNNQGIESPLSGEITAKL